MSEYQFAQKSALKLKGVAEGSGISKKKKKKSKKSSKEREERPSTSAREVTEEVEAGTSTSTAGGSSIPPEYRGKTKAEIRFLERQKELEKARIKDKAKVSHKEKVEKFNEYLNNLSEHYEQAKVSWTK